MFFVSEIWVVCIVFLFLFIVCIWVNVCVLSERVVNFVNEMLIFNILFVSIFGEDDICIVFKLLIYVLL